MSTNFNEVDGNTSLRDLRSIRRKKRRSISLYNDEQIEALNELPQVVENEEEDSEGEISPNNSLADRVSFSKSPSFSLRESISLRSIEDSKPPLFDPTLPILSRRQSVELQSMMKEQIIEEEESMEAHGDSSDEDSPIPPNLATIPDFPHIDPNESLSSSSEDFEQSVGLHDDSNNHSDNIQNDSSSIGSGETQNSSAFLDEGSFCEDQPSISDFLAKYEEHESGHGDHQGDHEKNQIKSAPLTPQLSTPKAGAAPHETTTCDNASNTTHQSQPRPQQDLTQEIQPLTQKPLNLSKQPSSNSSVFPHELITRDTECTLTSTVSPTPTSVSKTSPSRATPMHQPYHHCAGQMIPFLSTSSIRNTALTISSSKLQTPQFSSPATTQHLSCSKQLDKSSLRVRLTNPKYAKYQGRSVYYCGGRFVRGPKPIQFFLSFLFIILPLALFLPFVAVDINQVSGPWAFVLICFFTIISIITLFLASFTDPGILPRNDVDWNLTIHNYDEPSTATTTATTNAAQYPTHIKYCYTCKIFRPLRSVHCSICDNCVLHLDHHCPWIGTCVGGGNYHHFLYFLYSLLVEIFFSLATNIYALVAVPRWRQDQYGSWDDYSDAFRSYASDRPYPFILIVYSIFALAMVGWLWIFHIGLNTRNITTIEHLKRTYASEHGKNPFSRGWIKNIWQLTFPRQVRRPGYATHLPLESVSVCHVDIEPHNTYIISQQQQIAKDIDIHVITDASFSLHETRIPSIYQPNFIRTITTPLPPTQQQTHINTDSTVRETMDRQSNAKNAIRRMVYQHKLTNLLQTNFSSLQQRYYSDYDKLYKKSFLEQKKWAKTNPQASISSDQAQNDVESQRVESTQAAQPNAPVVLSPTAPDMVQVDNKIIKQWLCEKQLDTIWAPVRCNTASHQGIEADLAIKGVRFVSSWD